MKRTAGSTRLGLALLISCLATSLPLTGCSFLFVQPPHEEYGYRGVTGCTTSAVAPFIDTIFTVTNFASAAYVASEDNVTNKGTAVAVGVAVGALWLSSAIYGYHNTSRCSELQTDDYDERPYRGPVRDPRPTWRAPAAPRAAPPPPPPAVPPPPPPAVPPVDGAPAAPATEPAQVTPAPPVVPQQSDDDDPGRRQHVPGQYPVAPRYGN